MLAGGVGGVCSLDCLHGLKERARNKRQRRQEHKLARKLTSKQGRRIPGPERLRTRKRDNAQCRWCATTETLNLHHVIYRSEGGPDRAYNLMTLCRMHHEEVHSNKHLFQPVLLHILRTGDTRRVPDVLTSLTEPERYDAVMWGRRMRHGQVD